MNQQTGQNAYGMTEIRVRYAETDQMGIAYYANYPVWFEVGRGALMRSVGAPYSEMEADGAILPVSRVQYRLISPARYEDLLTILTRVDKIRSRSVEFSYEVRRDTRLLATGTTQHICVDQNMKPRSLPDRLRLALCGCPDR